MTISFLFSFRKGDDLSWQVVPNAMDEMMRDKDEKRKAQVTEAFPK